MNEENTAAELLRDIACDEKGSCAVCEAIMGHPCDDGDCSRWALRLADIVEAEVDKAYMDGTCHYIDMVAEEQGWPERKADELPEDYVKRGFLPMPRYEDGDPVEVGSVCECGVVAAVEVTASDGGWGDWLIRCGEDGEPHEGTLNQRVERGLLVEGRPVREGDSLWFDTERVTVTDVDGLSDTIFTDYLTEDGDGGWIPYPFESADLSWKRPAPKALDADGVPIEVGDTVYGLVSGREMVVSGLCAHEPSIVHCVEKLSDGDAFADIVADKLTHREQDSMERIREDARKAYIDYWGCRGIGCRECPAKVDGRTPYKRYGVDCGMAMRLDLVRRTEEVCGR